ncbi:MAG: chemotaxis protein CheW [Planctomycetes bacterium]|nr:chemotaxis protein CheW [Planctomycetota bacterium]
MPTTGVGSFHHLQGTLSLGDPFVLVELDNLVFALPISNVLEVLRPLPVEPVPGAPTVVSGLSIIRGEPTPVVNLRRLVGAPPAPPSRFLVVRAGPRRVALEVDAIRGVERIGREMLEAAPPLVSRAVAEALEAVSSLDGRLLLVLNAARLVPAAVTGGAA